MTTSVCECGRPTRDEAFVCDLCTEALSRALGDCAWVDDELETTITRQRAASTTGGAKSANTSLPWHERASDARRNLHGLLVSWVRISEEEGVRGRPSWSPRDNIPSMSRWLLHCVRGLALTDGGSQAVTEITDAVAECERIVFWKRRNRMYLGPCAETGEDGAACPGDVYAEEGYPVGNCDVCAAGVTVVIRKSELDKQLLDRLCTAAEIATYSTYLGLHADREQVRKRVNYWSRHHIVEVRGRTETGDPMYRYGEVRTMLYREFATPMRQDA